MILVSMEPHETHHWFVQVHFNTHSRKPALSDISRVCIHSDWTPYNNSHGHEDTFIIKDKVQTWESNPNKCAINLRSRGSKLWGPTQNCEIMVEKHPRTIFHNMSPIRLYIKLRHVEPIAYVHEVVTSRELPQFWEPILHYLINNIFPQQFNHQRILPWCT